MFPLTRSDHDVSPCDVVSNGVSYIMVFVYLDIYYSPCILHDDVFPLILCHIPNLEVYILFQYCSMAIQQRANYHTDIQQMSRTQIIRSRMSTSAK